MIYSILEKVQYCIFSKIGWIYYGNKKRPLLKPTHFPQA